MREEGRGGDENPRRRGVLSQLLDVFKDGETFDMRWTAMPKGHRALSEARRTNDVVLKHFHRPVELVLLPFQPGDDTTALQRGLQVPPTAVGHDSELPVWIRPHALEPDADVIVGETKVGSTTLAPAAWKALLAEAERGVYSDGALSWRSTSPANGGHAYELRCFLPRHLAS
jgi:hypothetical protein